MCPLLSHATMERLLFTFLVVGVIAVSSCVPGLPPPKDIGTGDKHVSVGLITALPYDNRTSDMETKIEKYVSKLGTLEGAVRAIDNSGQLQYNFTLLNANCTKVKSWITDVVNSGPDIFLPSIVECVPNKLYLEEKATDTDNTTKT
uniref:Uncharacterized protein n=1 Tax=Haemonchus contortus TaxID=6289 RepID=W6NQP6_HAECO